mgnify:CR=1 FL=1
MTVVWQTLFDLRRLITFRSNISSKSADLSDRCVVKVGNFEVELLVNKNVGALEVKVSNAFALQIFQCVKHLVEYKAAWIFTQATFALVNTAQITAFDVLESQVNAVTGDLARRESETATLAMPVDSENILVVERAQKSDLFFDVI